MLTVAEIDYLVRCYYRMKQVVDPASLEPGMAEELRKQWLEEYRK